MKKMIITLLLTTILLPLNACGGNYFDDGSRAHALIHHIRIGDVVTARSLLDSFDVAKEMRFKYGNKPYRSIVGIALELGRSNNKQKRDVMMPFVHLLKKHNFPVLPEDVETARALAGRDINGNKGALKPFPGDPKPRGVHARGLVSMVEGMPKLKKEPGDADYEENDSIELII